MGLKQISFGIFQIYRISYTHPGLIPDDKNKDTTIKIRKIKTKLSVDLPQDEFLE